MGKIYRVAGRRTAPGAAGLVVVIVVLAVTGLLSRAHEAAPIIAPAHAGVPAAAPPAPVEYFPSRFELNAPTPEAHVQAF